MLYKLLVLLTYSVFELAWALYTKRKRCKKKKDMIYKFVNKLEQKKKKIN